MYKLKSGVAVDINTEIDAIVRFTTQRWDDVGDLTQVLRLTYQQAAKDAKLWHDRDSLSRTFLSIMQARSALLEEIGSPDEVGGMLRRDRMLKIALNAGVDVLGLQEMAMNLEDEWDFEDSASRAYATVMQQHEMLSKARPKGWDTLAENYVEFAGVSNYDPADGKLFDGADSTWEGAPGYPRRIALPYVMYDEQVQGNRASLVLVSAAYAHFLRIVTHRNTEAILAEISMLSAVAAERRPVYDMEVDFVHPILKTLMDMGKYDRKTASESREAYTATRLRAHAEQFAGV